MWKAIKYLPENLSETIEMAYEYYGESWISDSEYLRWQNESNPVGPAIIQLARDVETDELAGQYVVIPMRFQANRETLIATLSLNTLTRQSYTGQGIFTGLAKAVYQDCVNQGMVFCYGFPNSNSYPGFTKKLGFTDLGSIPLLLRPLNPKSLVKKKLSNLFAPLSLPFHLFYRVKPLSDNRYEVYQLTRSDLLELNTFWAKVQDKYPIMGIRDADYIRWRYFDISYRNYQVYGIRLKNSSELLGYIVGRCTEVAAMAAGMIVDFLVDPNHPNAGNYLVNRLLRFFVTKNMDLAGSLMLSHTEESRILKGEGFFTCPKVLEPQSFPVIYRRLRPSLGEEAVKAKDKAADEKEYDDHDSFLHLDRWFLTMGDYDVI